MKKTITLFVLLTFVASIIPLEVIATDEIFSPFILDTRTETSQLEDSITTTTKEKEIQITNSNENVLDNTLDSKSIETELRIATDIGLEEDSKTTTSSETAIVEALTSTEDALDVDDVQETTETVDSITPATNITPFVEVSEGIEWDEATGSLTIDAAPQNLTSQVILNLIENNLWTVKHLSLKNLASINISFQNLTGLQTLHFASNITLDAIGSFKGLTSLTSVTGVIEMGVGAAELFADCTRLKEFEPKIYKKTTGTCTNLFSNTLLTQLSLKEDHGFTFNKIDNAFFGMTNLERFTGDSYFMYGQNVWLSDMFPNSTKLKQIDIRGTATGSNMLPIHQNFFKGFTSIEVVNFKASDNGPSFDNKQFKAVFSIIKGKLVSLHLDSNLLGDLKMTDLTSLKHFSSNRLTSLPASAFLKHKTIETVNLSAVESMGVSVFEQSSIQTAAMPKLKELSDKSFYGCANLSLLNVSEISTINNSSLLGTKNLKTIELNNVTTVGEKAFVASGIQELVLPALTTIKQGAFHGTNSLKYLNMPKISTIGRSLFYNSSDDYDQVETIQELGITYNNSSAIELIITSKSGYGVIASLLNDINDRLVIAIEDADHFLNCDLDLEKCQPGQEVCITVTNKRINYGDYIPKATVVNRWFREDINLNETPLLGLDCQEDSLTIEAVATQHAGKYKHIATVKFSTATAQEDYLYESLTTPISLTVLPHEIAIEMTYFPEVIQIGQEKVVTITITNSTQYSEITSNLNVAVGLQNEFTVSEIKVADLSQEDFPESVTIPKEGELVITFLVTAKDITAQEENLVVALSDELSNLNVSATTTLKVIEGRLSFDIVRSDMENEAPLVVFLPGTEIPLAVDVVTPQQNNIYVKISDNRASSNRSRYSLELSSDNMFLNKDYKAVNIWQLVGSDLTNAEELEISLSEPFILFESEEAINSSDNRQIDFEMGPDKERMIGIKLKSFQQFHVNETYTTQLNFNLTNAP